MVLVLLLMDSTQNLYFDFCEFINFLGSESNQKSSVFFSPCRRMFCCAQEVAFKASGT